MNSVLLNFHSSASISSFFLWNWSLCVLFAVNYVIHLIIWRCTVNQHAKVFPTGWKGISLFKWNLSFLLGSICLLVRSWLTRFFLNFSRSFILLQLTNNSLLTCFIGKRTHFPNSEFIQPLQELEYDLQSVLSDLSLISSEGQGNGGPKKERPVLDQSW